MTVQTLQKWLAQCDPKADVVIVVEPHKDDFPLHIEKIRKPNNNRRILIDCGPIDDRAVWE